MSADLSHDRSGSGDDGAFRVTGKWIVALLLAGTGFMVAAWMTSMSSDLGEIRGSVASISARVSSAEATLNADHQRQTRIEVTLDRVEAKLDRIQSGGK